MQDDQFKSKARLHQSNYRAEVLKATHDVYVNMLTEVDGRKGLNFYHDFAILDAVYDRYGKIYSKQLYSNLLRSEHIPFNFFIPLRYDLELARNVLNEFFSSTIKKITAIKIEYAPKPKEKYLNDATSFDAYIEYQHIDGQIGIIGIEVKYTEHGYPLKPDSKEDKDIHNCDSLYWQTTHQSGIFKEGVGHQLITDDNPQIWRNQLLGERMKQVDNIEHFTSITLYPKGNQHFSRVLPIYRTFLKRPDSLIGITYEDFFESLLKHSTNNRVLNWVNYLKNRYLVIME